MSEGKSFGEGIGLSQVPLVSGIDLCNQYLMERGFNPEPFMDATGIVLGTEDECLESVGFTRRREPDRLRPKWGLIIPYPNTGYSTVRWLNPRKGQAKMIAPKGVTPPCYIPTTVDWSKYDGTLYICESAIKALALSTRGYYALSGNGVDGIATRRGFPSNWPQHILDGTHRVVILYDSDVDQNAGVRAAVERLFLALRMRWPTLDIELKVLPAPEDPDYEGKWGIDDAVARLGPDWLSAWLGGEEDVNPIRLDPLHRHFVELNAKYAVCRHPAGIVDQDTGNVYKESVFKGVLEAPRVVHVGENNKEVSAAGAWMKYEGRMWVEELRYQPGGDEVVREEYFNRWVDDGVAPVEGGVLPFLDYMENAVPDDVTRDLLLKSVAWMMQNRGTRMEKTFMLVGAQQSTGKSTFTKIVRKCFGPRNSVSIDPEQFKGRFNAHFATKEIVVMEEVHEIKGGTMAKLKSYVTSDVVQVEIKGIEAWPCDNYAVYFMTSNEADSLELDDADRRALIVEFRPEVFYPQGDPYWDALYGWLEGGGYGMIRWWFENMDLSDFDPGYMPPMNAMKQHMISAGRRDRDNFINQIMRQPEEVLPDNGQCLFTAHELEQFYNGFEEASRGDVIRMGKALKKKFKAVNGGGSINIKQHPTVLWCIRGDKLAEEWTNDEARTHYVEVNKSF